MDDPDCDSTWEEDEGAEDGEDDASDEDAGDEDGDSERPRPGAFQSRMTGYRNWRAMQDMCRYRRHYPDLIEQDCNGDMSNLSFYKNEICFQPNGCFIEDFLQNWKDNYDVLEENHSYIQWLFPLREPGVNWHAKPLTLREVEAFKSSKEIRERFVQAYELMLGFYGIQLEDRDTGAVCRAKNYQQRFQNLNCRSHNNLRITRILKSLGELGLQHYQAPLVHFFLHETLVTLQLPGVLQSALDYFLFAVRCPRQRRELIHFAWKHFRPRCKFVWGPHDKLRRFRPQAAPRPLVGSGQAVGDEGPGDPLQKAETQDWSCGADQTGEGRVAEGPELLSTKRQDVRTLDKDQEDEAESLSPKDSKKRKLEANRQEQASGEPDPQGVSEVEKIAMNLEGCALGPGSQELGEAEQPSPSAPKASVSDEVRKRRKVEEGAGGDGRATNRNTEVLPHPCWSGENEFEDPKSQVEPEQSTPENLVEDLGCPVGDPGSPAEGPGSPVGDSGSPVGDSGSPVGGPGSPVGDPGSPAEGPGSPVEGPGSSMEGPGTAGTAADESGKVAGMETAKPPKP